MRRTFLLASLLAAAMQPATAAERPVADVDPGITNGICIGTEAECSAKRVNDALKGIDLLATFDKDSAELKPEVQQRLQGIAGVLNEGALKSRRFIVEGYTDASGTEVHNQGLSERRAEAVRAFLVSNGVDASRLAAVGKGATGFRTEDPLDAANRRVELRLLTL